MRKVKHSLIAYDLAHCIIGNIGYGITIVFILSL